MDPWYAAKVLIGLVVLGLLLYAVWLLLGVFRLPEPFPTVILIIFALVALGFVWRYGGGGPFPPA